MNPPKVQVIDIEEDGIEEHNQADLYNHKEPPTTDDVLNEPGPSMVIASSYTSEVEEDENLPNPFADID